MQQSGPQQAHAVGLADGTDGGRHPPGAPLEGVDGRKCVLDMTGVGGLVLLGDEGFEQPIQQVVVGIAVKVARVPVFTGLDDPVQLSGPEPVRRRHAGKPGCE